MTNNITYYPILKWKAGERTALKQTSVPNNLIIPIFEFVDDQSVEPIDFFNKVHDCCTGPFYFSTIRIDDNQKSILKNLTDYASQNSIRAYPILYPEDIDTGLVKSISEHVEYFGFVIPMPEDSISNYKIISKLLTYVDSKNINLFINAGTITENHEANIIAFAYKDFFNKEATVLAKFNNITYTACSIPEELSAVESGGIEFFPRYNFSIFTRLINDYKNNALINKLSYSDYGIAGISYTDFDPRKMKILPKIKYTTYDNYIVLKGKKNWTTSTLIKGYKELAREVVNSDYYFGKDFSYGDAEINEIANTQNSKTGNNCQWVGYNTNHHIAVIVSQLAILAGA